jgi:predicted XRE-type DNA-binding protein
MSKNRFVDVWDAIGGTHEEAENMKLRSALMMALKAHLVRTDLSQAQIAKLFGVTQQRVSDLMRPDHPDQRRFTTLPFLPNS